MPALLLASRAAIVLCAVLLAALGPALGPAASPSAAPPAAAQSGTAVRIGTLGIIADAPVYIAADRGYFAEQGLAPTLERFDTGAQMIAPMAAGQLDAGAGTPAASLYNAIGRDLQLRIV